VPVEVIEATYEAALGELASPGSLTPDIVRAGRRCEEEMTAAATY
jgi:hypothetical protein